MIQKGKKKGSRTGEKGTKYSGGVGRCEANIKGWRIRGYWWWADDNIKRQRSEKCRAASHSKRVEATPFSCQLISMPVPLNKALNQQLLLWYGHCPGAGGCVCAGQLPRQPLPSPAAPLPRATAVNNRTLSQAAVGNSTRIGPSSVRVPPAQPQRNFSKTFGEVLMVRKLKKQKSNQTKTTVWLSFVFSVFFWNRGLNSKVEKPLWIYTNEKKDKQAEFELFPFFGRMGWSSVVRAASTKASHFDVNHLFVIFFS